MLPLEFIPLIHQLADAAGAIIRPYFRNVGFENKQDSTPVTLADRGAEKAIRTILKKARPHDGVWGEEFGADNMDAEWAWVIDPIDGTKAFIRGMPLFATLIGLRHKTKTGDIFVLGVIDQPILKERWIGGSNMPASFNGKTIKTRTGLALGDAVLNATAPSMFENENAANGTKYKNLERNCRYALYGGDAYAYGLLANGFIDIQVDTSLKPHDYAALVPVIESAGGRITDWNGAALTMQSDGRVIAAGDAALHNAALPYLRD